MSNTYAPMTAPASTGGSSKPKNPNIQLVPMGMQPAIIYSVVNVGTHAGEFQGKPNKSNKIKIGFEFPTHRQQFYLDDTELRPSVMTMDFTYSMSKSRKTMKKSKLLEFVEGLFGPIQEANYLTFDVSSVLDMKVFATIQHYTKQDGKIGAKIVNVSPFNPGLINPDTIQRTNPLARYHIGMGFQCKEFASLYYFLRQEIKDSEEGKSYAAQGGKFAKLDENGNLILDDSNDSYAAAPVPVLGKMIMTNPQFSYEQMKQAGWTDEALISAGHAYREQVIQQPAPVPTQQPVPLPQTPPVPVVPIAPVAPAQPKLEMIDTTVTYEQYIQGGWNDELLIQHGKARMVMPVQAPPVVQTPPVPAVPVAPVVPVAPAIPVAPQNPAALFAQTAPAPVQNMGAPTPTPIIAMPVAPTTPPAPISSFEQMPAMPGVVSDEELDDLPF